MTALNSHLLLKSLFSIIARFIGVGLNFALRIFLTRTLPSNEAGIIFLLMTFITGTSLLSRLGLEQLTVKEVASAHETDTDYHAAFLKKTYVLMLSMSFVAMLIWWLLSPSLSSWFFHDEVSVSTLRFAGLGLLFFNIVIINTFYLKAVQQTIRSVLSQNALPAISFILLLAVFWQSYRAEQFYLQLYVYSLLLASIISLLITLPWYTTNAKPKTPPPDYKKLLQKALPLAPVSIFSFFMLWADTLMVGFFLDNSSVAFFNTAATISFVSLFFLGALEATIYPRLLNIAKHQPKRLKAFFWQSTLLVVAVLCLVTLMMMFFSAPLLHVFGKEYVIAQSSLNILLAAQLLRATSLTFSFMFIIREQVKYLNIILALAMIINLCANALLIQHYQMEGAAAATLIANAFLALFVILIFYKKRLLVKKVTLNENQATIS